MSELLTIRLDGLFVVFCLLFSFSSLAEDATNPRDECSDLFQEKGTSGDGPKNASRKKPLSQESVLEMLRAMADAGVVLSTSEARNLPENSPHIAVIDQIRKETHHKSARDFVKNLHWRAKDLFQGKGGYYGALEAAGVDTKVLRRNGRKEVWPTPESAIETLHAMKDAGITLTAKEAQNLPENSPYAEAIDRIRKDKKDKSRSARAFMRLFYLRLCELFRERGGYYGALKAVGITIRKAKRRVGHKKNKRTHKTWPTWEAVVETLQAMKDAGVVLTAKEAHSLPENSPLILNAINEIRQGAYKSSKAFAERLYVRANQFKERGGYYGALEAAGVDVDHFRPRLPLNARRLPADFISGPGKTLGQKPPTPRELLENKDAAAALASTIKELSDRENELVQSILREMEKDEDLPLTPEGLVSYFNERGNPYTQDEIQNVFHTLSRSKALREYFAP